MTDVTGGLPETHDDDQRVADADRSPGEPRSFTGAANRRQTAAEPTAEDSVTNMGSTQVDPSAYQGSLLVAGIETAEAKAKELQRWAELRQDVALDYVRAHPMSSSATAFGAGLIMGLLLARR